MISYTEHISGKKKNLKGIKLWWNKEVSKSANVEIYTNKFDN